MHRYRWKSRPDVGQLGHQIDALKTVVIRMRRELENKQGANGRLKLLVRQLTQTIDDLVGKLEQSQAQIRRLDAENDHLAALFRQS